MRIAQVCHSYHPCIGGVETNVKEISERLATRHDIFVLTTDPSGKLPREETINSVCVRRFKSWAPNGAYYFSKDLKRYLIENSKDYDIVHAHNYHAFPALYAAQGKDSNRLVFTLHYHGGGHTFFRSLLHIPYKYLAKKILEKADRVVCVSNYEKSLIMKNFKLDAKRVVIIPNGVDTKEFEGLQKKRGGEKVILCVSRLEKYKGVQYLIQALTKLSQDVVLEVVGEGPYKESLVKLTRKLGVENRVKFFHDLPRKDLLQKYTRADLFVLLSKYEAFAISIAEALAARTPCIVASTSALTEWVDGRNCFGIEYPVDVDELGNLVRNVIAKDVGKLKLYDWEYTARELMKIYEEFS